MLSSLPTRVLATATSALAVQAGLQIAAPLSSVSDTNMHRAPQRAHSSADRSAAMNEPGKSKTNNNKTATKGKSKSKSFPLTRTSRLIEGGAKDLARIAIAFKGTPHHYEWKRCPGRRKTPYARMKRNAGMAKLADAADLKSAGPKGLWGFDSPSRHQPERHRQDRPGGLRAQTLRARN